MYDHGAMPWEYHYKLLDYNIIEEPSNIITSLDEVWNLFATSGTLKQ